MVHQKSERDYRAALQNYRKNSLDEAKISAGTLNRVLGDIYRDIRTISVLPSVRKIDLHGTNLDDDARESIQQIYNNLRSTVDVSEIYIVPVDFNPDAIDPVTHKLQKPILMFDEHIAAASSNAEALEEVETYEYRQLHQTLGWFKAHYPDHNHVSTIALPMVSGTPVITCDNTRFQKTRQDQDRTGIILSVPFYGPDKQLKGTISAILLNETLRKLLLDTDYALINPDYSLVISEKGGQDEVSQNWLMQSKPDPHLLYSAVLPLEVQDPRSHWALWVGFPDKKFL